MKLELLIAVLFHELLVYRGLLSIRRTRMRIIAISFGTLVIVAAVSAVLQSSVYQSLVSQSISRYSADEQVSLITAVKLYRKKLRQK
jgi:hypothetical protein